METALTITTGSELAIMPVMDIQMALNRRKQIMEFIKAIMVKGVDYGAPFPGVEKPALLKPGAEKLTTLFGLTKKFTIIEKVEDWDGNDHNGEPFFYYLYRCSLWRGDYLIAEADGSCNSHESKYRYRNAERVCPNCGKETIKKSKQDPGWYCWSKLGGCGKTFKAGDKAIEGQEVGKVLNPDVADQANTVLKMSQKRALVGATLLATNASEFFSTKEVPGRDEDDAPVETPFEVVEPEPKNGKAKTTGNGWNPQKLLEAVQVKTGTFYKTTEQLYKALGGVWPDFSNREAVGQAISNAVDAAAYTE